MITPTSGTIPYPPSYVPAELDFGQREDVQARLQQIADALDECDGMLQQGRNGIDGAGTAVDHSHDPDFVPLVSSSEIYDSASNSDETSGFDALPIPTSGISWPSDSEIGEGLSSAVLLALMLVAYMAEERANGRLNSAIVRKNIADALDEIARLMETSTIAQGAGGIVSGGIGVGGASVSASMLRTGKGADADGFRKSKIDMLDGSTPTTTKKVDITDSDGQMDSMQASMDDFSQRRRDGGVDAAGNASRSNQMRGQAGDPNGEWQAGLDGMPGMGSGNGRSAKGLAGDSGADYGPGRNGAPGMDGAAGNPNGQYGPGRAGMPGMDGSTPGGNGLAGNPQAKFGSGDVDMPGMDGRVSGRQGMAGDPQGVYRPGGSDMPGMNKASGTRDSGLAGDPEFDWNNAPSGRPGMPGMGEGGGNRSGRTGAGNGANGAEIDIDVNQRRNGGISQDHMDGAEATTGNSGSSHRYSSEEQTSGPSDTSPSSMQENWRQGWGQDPNASTQQNTARAQAVNQGTQGLGGLAGAGGGIGSGLAGAGQKAEEANVERDRASLDGQDSINRQYQDTYDQLMQLAKDIATKDREALARIMG